MKVFICGLPKAGKSTVVKELCKRFDKLDMKRRDPEWLNVNAISWVKGTFRLANENETPDSYGDDYHNFYINRIKNDPKLIIDNVRATIAAYNFDNVHWLIDGIFSPKDFCDLFDYNNDIVVFLNRTDGESDAKDYESIGISVMRDYCFWLASADLLPRNRWLEYNFKIPGEHSDMLKEMGSKNTVYIVKSLNKVIDHLAGVMLSSSSGS